MNTFEKVGSTAKTTELSGLRAGNCFILPNEGINIFVVVDISLIESDQSDFDVTCISLRGDMGSSIFSAACKVIPVDLEIKWSYS